LSETSFDYIKVVKTAERKQPGQIVRVNQLKEAVISGRYHVDSWRVAERMVMGNLIFTMTSVKPEI
jgi:anti-sigma28 factor (negative regulator of flagellin synthesis)